MSGIIVIVKAKNASSNRLTGWLRDIDAVRLDASGFGPHSSAPVRRRRSVPWDKRALK
jgi:hypothetical protein